MLQRNVACSNCLALYDANDMTQCPRCGSCGRCDVNSVPDREISDTSGWVMGGSYARQEELLDNPDFQSDEGWSYDPVKIVKHYQVFAEHGIEARHIIARCIQLSGLSGTQAYHYGNALKYLLRLNRKGDMREDASKAQEYLGYMKDEDNGVQYDKCETEEGRA